VKIAATFLFFFAALLPLFSELGYIEPWGKEAEMILSLPPPSPPTERDRTEIMTYLALQVVLFRQKVLSPADGPRSHFSPTSSQYMLDAIKTHGLLKGYVMGCDRLLRENREQWVYHVWECKEKIYKWDPVPRLPRK